MPVGLLPFFMLRINLQRRLDGVALGLLSASIFIGWLGAAVQAQAGALENYVGKPDTNYSWKQIEQKQDAGFTITHLELTSQQWRESTWRHHLQVVRPEQVRHADIAFLFITGD